MIYTMRDFRLALRFLLSPEAYKAGVKCELLSHFGVNEWCELVAREMLLGNINTADTAMLNVIKTTAKNLWSGSGCHELVKE